MRKMRSKSQHDPWGSMYAVPDKEQAKKTEEEIPSVVFPVPPISEWNALVAEVKKSKSTNPYLDVAMDVLSEMRKYTGYTYAAGFKESMDVSRLAIAIQRFVEHKLDGGCKHDEPCKG